MTSAESDTTVTMLSLPEQIRIASELGASVAEIQGISESTLESMYSYAYDFYKKGQLDDAELFFKFLCIYDLKNPDYLMGYGAVCQLKEEYQRAYDLYCLSFTASDSASYQPVYFMGLCQLGLKNTPTAITCFRSVAENSHDEELVKKASLYLRLLHDGDQSGAEENVSPDTVAMAPGDGEFVSS